ncbi:MAG: translation initiation factor IF-2 [Lachnospiraceae bacterium]|nr:translation initiation factor IF-2 [Lachnospiraceae bacterium]
MAKTKIGELEKMFGVDRKVIIKFLNDNGVEAKTASSSVEDDAVEMVRKEFASQTAKEAPKEKAQKEAAPAEKAPVKEAPEKKGPEEKAAGENVKEAPAEKKAPPKKKKIIIVTNQDVDRRPGTGGRRPRPYGGMRDNRGRMEAQNAYRPIKPISAPSRMEVDFKKPAPPEKTAPAEKEAVDKKQTAAEAPVQEQVTPQTPAPAPQAPSTQRPARPARPEGAPQAQGGRNQGGRGQAPGRDKAQGRDDAQGRGDGQGGKKGQDNRRKGAGDKDKRNKKDLMFQEDNERARKNRPGRFIKPEKKEEEAPEEQIKVISIPEKLTIRELAEKMRMQPAEIIKKLFLQGKPMTNNSEVTYEEAEAIALDYDILCEKEETVDVIEELLREEEDDPKDMTERAPVICVMGHVDHGKTSLLDKIRSTSVTDKEAGGITQHIGAYTVKVNDRKFTFLDTPGHEAFTAMRMRGASSTDIAVLVVAADDGVMPQTVEAINHAKAAGVEIIVAVNKIDKPEANIERVKQMMTEYELVATDWGGSTEFVPVSAKTGEGIETLLETILLTADILELKANANRRARGLVLEAKLDKGRGPVANVLIQKGTLHVGDYISAGEGFGRVRAMVDDKGRRVKEAKPSQPVEVLGLSDVPGAGETIIAHADEKTARSYAMTYKTQHKADLIEETRMRMSLDDLFNQMKEGNLKEFNLILKADVQGSVEALKQSLLKLSNEEVVVKVIHTGVGAINESDITLASASNAVVIGFNVVPDALARAMADREKVEVRLYKVIYQAIDDVEAALKGMLAPVYEEKVIGHAEVRQIFKASAVGNIAGSYVLDGVFKKGCKIRIRRGDEQIYEGALASLKRFKDDVKEVKEGFECGLVFDGFDQMQVGDIAEAFELVEVPRT